MRLRGDGSSRGSCSNPWTAVPRGTLDGTIAPLDSPRPSGVEIPNHMKVSFLKAPIGGIIGLEMITFVEPLGLECVAGGLENEGHACQILDLRIDGMEKGMDRL